MSLVILNLTKKEIFHVAYEAERHVHGTPSGIDPAVSTYRYVGQAPGEGW